MRKIIRILVGIPCSGKSTYSQKEELSLLNQAQISISRDDIRNDIENASHWNDSSYKYRYSKVEEELVTIYFNDKVYRALTTEVYNTIILDNTHCKEKYIDEIISKYGNEYKIEIKFFDILLLKAHYRNIIRRIKTGKWIPIKVMNNMYNNYNKINKKKYEQYKC